MHDFRLGHGCPVGFRRVGGNACGRHCHRLRAALRCLALLATLPLSGAPLFAAELTPAELIGALQHGGLVVYVRHAATHRFGGDRADWPRVKQRLLSDEGERLSDTIGRVFRRYEIPVGDILVSPFARSQDMALIAFGRAEVRAGLLDLLSEPAGRQERIDYSIRLLSEPVGARGNRVLFGHSSNIREATGVPVSTGGAVVVRPEGSDRFTVLGTLAPTDWLMLANEPPPGARVFLPPR